MDHEEGSTNTDHSPLLHLAGGDVDAVSLAPTAHREEDVEGGEAMALVTLGDRVERDGVLENVVVEREVAAVRKNSEIRQENLKSNESSPGNQVDAVGLDALKAVLANLGGELEELLRGGLAGPVSLDGLFDLTVGAWEKKLRDDPPSVEPRLTDAGKSENAGVNHD
jgi:hypothetical protein